MSANDFLIGAVQPGHTSFPAEANPSNPQFDLDALDAHVERCTQRTLKLLERAGRKGLDLVLGGEDIQDVAGLIGLKHKVDLLHRYSHRVGGELCDRIGAIAATHGMLIGACFFEGGRGRYYNTSILFDGRGGIVGKYRKVHLPPQEICVLTGGKEFPVFKTPLGRVGMMICYDTFFPESVRCLALNGADLVLHPTAGYGWTERCGDVMSAARAMDNDVCIVMACRMRSQVLNRWGDRLADAGKRADAIVSARLDPREPREYAEGHYHRVATGIAEIRGNLFRERVPEAYRALTSRSCKAYGAIGNVYTPRRKAFIRRLAAEVYDAMLTGGETSYHWTSRKD